MTKYMKNIKGGRHVSFSSKRIVFLKNSIIFFQKNRIFQWEDGKKKWKETGYFCYIRKNVRIEMLMLW